MSLPFYIMSLLSIIYIMVAHTIYRVNILHYILCFGITGNHNIVCFIENAKLEASSFLIPLCVIGNQI